MTPRATLNVKLVERIGLGREFQHRMRSNYLAQRSLYLILCLVSCARQLTAQFGGGVRLRARPALDGGWIFSWSPTANSIARAC